MQVEHNEEGEIQKMKADIEELKREIKALKEEKKGICLWFKENLSETPVKPEKEIKDMPTIDPQDLVITKKGRYEWMFYICGNGFQESNAFHGNILRLEVINTDTKISQYWPSKLGWYVKGYSEGSDYVLNFSNLVDLDEGNYIVKVQWGLFRNANAYRGKDEAPGYIKLVINSC